MACCGGGKKKTGFQPNRKTCKKCGWAMNRVHKYNSSRKQVDRYWICSNKALRSGMSCGYREVIK